MTGRLAETLRPGRAWGNAFLTCRHWYRNLATTGRSISSSHSAHRVGARSGAVPRFEPGVYTEPGDPALGEPGTDIPSQGLDCSAVLRTPCSTGSSWSVEGGSCTARWSRSVSPVRSGRLTRRPRSRRVHLTTIQRPSHKQRGPTWASEETVACWARSPVVCCKHERPWTAAEGFTRSSSGGSIVLAVLGLFPVCKALCGACAARPSHRSVLELIHNATDTACHRAGV